MITFDTHGDTPLSVRIVRVVVPLLLFFAYLLGRVYPAADGRIPAGEALVMGVVLIGLAFTGLIALGDLIAPLTPRMRSRLDSEALEITAVHAPVVTDIDAAIDDAREQSWPRNTVTVPAALFFGQGRVTGTLPPEPYVQVGAGPDEYIVTIPDDATAPLHLFTHDYAPQHHTPPRGIRLVGDHGEGLRAYLAPALAKVAADLVEDARRMRPPAAGRHHRNDKD